MQIERAFLSALPTEPLYGFSHAVVPSTQQKATCVYRAPARHSRNPHAKYSALPNVSNAMWAGQTLLCLIVPPSGKMGTICASLPLNRYKPMHFSAQGRTIITQKPRSKRHGRPFVFVLFHRRERANKGSRPILPLLLLGLPHSRLTPVGATGSPACFGGARPSGMRGPVVPSMRQRLTQLQLLTPGRRKES